MPRKSATNPSQRAIVAAGICRRSGLSPRHAAKLVGDVSHTSVYAALKILDGIDDATRTAIERGEATVHGLSNGVHQSQRFTVAITTEQHARLRALSSASGVPIRTLARRAIDVWLDLAERGGGEP